MIKLILLLFLFLCLFLDVFCQDTNPTCNISFNGSYCNNTNFNYLSFSKKKSLILRIKYQNCKECYSSSLKLLQTYIDSGYIQKSSIIIVADFPNERMLKILLYEYGLSDIKYTNSNILICEEIDNINIPFVFIVSQKDILGNLLILDFRCSNISLLFEELIRYL